MTQALYEALYAGGDYRKFSPGEMRLPDFYKLVPLAPDDVVIDFGCGTGRATANIAKRCKAVGVDFVRAIETDVEFHQRDLRRKLPVAGTKGFCCDVMEHIAPRDVGRVLRNIMSTVDTCYFQICTVPDEFGASVGEPLHLTVKPFWWWARKLDGLGMVRYAREEKHHGIFVLQRSIGIKELDKRIEIMEPEEVLRANVRANLAAGYVEAEPRKVQSTEVALLAGGPSLSLFNDWTGPVITVNGAYNWAIQHGYKPAAQFVVDPRELNKRFVQPVAQGCQYFIGSQCHPSIAASLPKEQVRLWHGGDMAPKMIKEWAEETGQERTVYPVFGGSTVMLRAIPLLMMLGIRKIHIYGFDSCLLDDRHHAYAQAENDGAPVMDVLVGGRTFKCHPWMAVQAQEFIELVKHMLPEDAELAVYGDGLIAHILKTGAHFYEQQLEAA